LIRGYTESFIADIYNNFYIPGRRTLIYDRLDKNKHNVVTSNQLTLCTTYSHIIKHILDYSLITPGEITRQFEVDYKQLFNKQRIIFKNKPNLTLLLTDYSHFRNTTHMPYLHNTDNYTTPTLDTANIDSSNTTHIPTTNITAIINTSPNLIIEL
jgi:hypothetical protein